MTITLNGKKVEVQGRTLNALVKELGFQPESLVVEKNKKLIKRDNWAATPLHEGDCLELLNFVGGG
ncbi:MAG: thiamine biosynthesis protein ThiS [Desulfobulbus sp.]|nr:MAG: thiamine biosynthesis protein ThiS [Desulfobulbus sp.]RUM38579.1 MAG: thiamine biosynthesis protein ThiS [Desulfobulbus sp.]